MKRNSLNFLCVLVVGAMLLAVFMPITFVGAGVDQPHNIWGTNTKSGTDIGGAGDIAAFSEITGWIDGVNYGINITNTSYPTWVDLYVMGDEWGVEPDNWVKDGGYEGDTIQYFLDYSPLSYDLTISDYTSTFEPGAAENVDLFFDTQTDTDSNYPGPGGTYLRGLKINEIVLSPWPYVYIWDRNGELDETYLEDATHGYYLEKDDPNPTNPPDPNGPYFEFSANPNAVEPFGAPNYYYVNLSGFALDNDDELKLVWKNPAKWGGTPTANNIANGTDVIVDRVEWGNHNNYIHPTTPPDDRDYDNTTLSNAIGLPVAGESFIRSPNGTDTDDCANDFIITSSPTPWPPEVGGGTPGAPINLRVHKGGGGWGGTTSDLVLNWTAPSVDWGFLVKNIVYWDTDLSDGFQYTNHQLFDPISTGSGTPDGAELGGFLADGNNYALIVHTTGDATQGGSNENPTGTNVGYKYGMTLLQNVGLSSQMVISVPYFNDWNLASDITGVGTEFPDNSIIDTISIWNYATQTWNGRSWNPLFSWWEDDFPVNPGDTLVVTITTTTPYTWNLVGAYNDTFEFVFLQNVGTSSQIFTSLPYHKSYTMASDVTGGGTEFPTNSIVDTVSQWNYATQTWNGRSWNPLFSWWEDDFAIFASPGDHLVFTITTTAPYNWQPQVIGL